MNSTWTEGTHIFVGGRVEAFEFVDMVFSDVGLKAMPVVPLVFPLDDTRAQVRCIR